MVLDGCLQYTQIGWPKKVLGLQLVVGPLTVCSWWWAPLRFAAGGGPPYGLQLHGGGPPYGLQLVVGPLIWKFAVR